MIRKIVPVVIVLMLMVFIVSGCAPGGGRYDQQKRAGFFTGIWHGWIAPVCLIVQIFKPEIRIYETANTGWWYDFGFYIAIISGFGSLSLTRKKRKHKDD